MKIIDKSRPVMVTGGTGYMASWIIKMLLEEGINVNTTGEKPWGQGEKPWGQSYIIHCNPKMIMS